MASRCANPNKRNSLAWSYDDEAVFLQHAHDENWLAAVAKRFPAHSLGALKTKMSRLRSDLGIKGRRGAREEDQDRANAKAAVASELLLEATLRVGRWS